MYNQVHFNAPIDVRKLIFQIGEVSRMAEVSPRQIRYWDKKGFIESQRHDESSSRVYNFFNLMRIGSIKGFLDDGYTLKAAVAKTDERQEMMFQMHQFLSRSTHGIDVINGEPMVNLGYFDDQKTQLLYGYLANGEPKYRVLPVDNEKA